MARCKRCNKSATLYNGYCAACLSVLNRQANSLIDPADDPDIAPISPEGSLDAPGSYAKMVQSKTVGVWDPKNANVDNTKAEDKPAEGKSKAADFSIVKGEFTGKDGEGYITDVKNDIDYDKNNQQLAAFVNDTSLDYDTSYELSNGDEVTITVKYSQETAKANKIKVTNDSKTFKVKGLIERYKNAAALPDDLIEELESEANDEAEDQFDDGYSTTYNYSLDSMWFAKGDDYDRGIAVYKVDATRTSSWNNEVTQNTYYYAFYTSTEIDSAYLDDDNSHYWRYTYLNAAEGVENSLKTEFDDYSIEKIK